MRSIDLSIDSEILIQLLDN